MNLLELVKQDMKPAFGVTEPGAIAFAVAKAKEYIEGEVVEVVVELNSGMYKNAFTCGIPNSNEYGNVFAAALGVVGGKAELGLESLSCITPEDNVMAQAYIDEGKVKVKLHHIGSEIYIYVMVKSAENVCELTILDGHTNIVEIKVNENIVFENKVDDEKIIEDENQVLECIEKKEEAHNNESTHFIHQFTVKGICEYVASLSLEEVKCVKEAFTMNMELFEMGLASDKTSFIHVLRTMNHGEIISEDAVATAQLLASGAIEARVLGLPAPAMSITGSGAHGIIATLPLYAYWQTHLQEVSEEQVLQSVVLSYLITMYIKEYSGKLSAFCGCGIAAGTGVACGLAYLKQADYKVIEKVIRNMAAGITGMICDGGNHGCVMKGVVAVDVAFRTVEFAMAEAEISGIHGINGMTAEDTMRNMGRIAAPGMVQTEEEIVHIMEDKE